MDVASSIDSTFDLGYILTGSTNSNNGDVFGQHGGFDVWVVKLDSSGLLQWQKCFGGSSGDGGKTIIQTSDSGYILLGATTSINGDVVGFHGGISDIWVIKIDSIGTVQWQRCLGGSDEDDPGSIIETTGGYLIAGSTSSIDGDLLGIPVHGSGDFWLIKLDYAGNILWQKCYGGSESDWAKNLDRTNDSGFVVVGTSISTDGDLLGTPLFTGANIWAIKIDAVGNIIWSNALVNGPAIGAEFGYSGRQMHNSTYIIGGDCSADGGYVSGNHGLSDYWLIYLDSSGNFITQICLGGRYSDNLENVFLTSDGGFVLIGTSNSDNGDVTGIHFDIDGAPSKDFWILKFDSLGGLLWKKCLGGGGPELGHAALDIKQDELIVVGEELSDYDGDVTCSTLFNSDVWIVKLSSTPNAIIENEHNDLEFTYKMDLQYEILALEYISRNFDYINVALFDLMGKSVAHQISKTQSGINKIELGVSNLRNGIYFITISNSKENVTKKFLLHR